MHCGASYTGCFCRDLFRYMAALHRSPSRRPLISSSLATQTMGSMISGNASPSTDRIFISRNRTTPSFGSASFVPDDAEIYRIARPVYFTFLIIHHQHMMVSVIALMCVAWRCYAFRLAPYNRINSNSNNASRMGIPFMF